MIELQISLLIFIFLVSHRGK